MPSALKNRALLDDLITPLFASKPTAAWLELLREADILCGPINDFADVAADPNLTASLPLVDPLAPNVPQAVGVPIRRKWGLFNYATPSTCQGRTHHRNPE